MSGRSREGGGHHAGGAAGSGGPPWLLSFGERNEAQSYPYPTQKRRDDPSGSMISRPVVEEVYYYDQPPMRPSRTDSSASHLSGTGAAGIVTHTDDFCGTVLHSSKDQKMASTKVKSIDPQCCYGTHLTPAMSKAEGISLSFSGSSKADPRAGGGSADSRREKSNAYHPRHGPSEPQPQETEKRPDVIIEVAPGVLVVLRGSQETWEAIKDDFYMPCHCIGCDTSLFVIQDAAYVLCPQCYSVVPLEGEFIDRAVSGVGMGFVIEDLMQWQQEILRDRL